MASFNPQKFSQLPEPIQDLILSPELTQFNQKIKEKFSLSEKQFDTLSHLIMEVFFKEIKVKDFFSLLKKRLKISEEEAKELTQEIFKNYFLPAKDYLKTNLSSFIKESGEKAEKIKESLTLSEEDKGKSKEVKKSSPLLFSLDKGVKMDIRSALKQFREELEEIYLTKDFIFSKDLNHKVIPTVVNWLKDYLAEKGAKRHSIVERADYLFASKNPQKLSSEEKKKVSLVLKSYDEGIPLFLQKKDKFLSVSLPQEEEFANEIEEPKTKISLSWPKEEEEKKITLPRIDVKKEEEEEKKEIESLKKKFPTSFNREEDRYRKILSKIIEKSGQKFKDPILQQRFEEIILTRLKDLRDRLETKENLIKNPSEGGLGLDETKAEEIISLIEKEISQIKKEEKEKTISKPKPSFKISPPIKEIKEVEKLPSYQKQKVVPLSSLKEEKTSTEKEEKIKVEEKRESKYQIQKPRRESKAVLPEEEKVEPTKTDKQISVKKKPVIVDVAYVPKVIGPIEELLSLNLKSFRRLGETAKERVEKIEEKIKLLGEESPQKEIKAIEAWRGNKVFQLYLEIGRQGIEKGKSVEEIIRERKLLGQPTLEMDEFQAITDLNSKLRY